MLHSWCKIYRNSFFYLVTIVKSVICKPYLREIVGTRIVEHIACGVKARNWLDLIRQEICNLASSMQSCMSHMFAIVLSVFDTQAYMVHDT